MVVRSSSWWKLVPKLVLVLVAGIFSWLPPIDGRTQHTELVCLASLIYCLATYTLNKSSSALKHLLAVSHLAAGWCVHYSATSQGQGCIFFC